MISLIKRMKRPQVITAVLCMLVVTAGSYFELKLPDYMSSLTLLIQAGAEDVSAILNIGLEMLLIVAISAMLTVASGYLSARTAAGYTRTLREELFQEIWDMGPVGDIATVTVHIKKIREKIEKDSAKPQYIETIWGVGYRFKI